MWRIPVSLHLECLKLSSFACAGATSRAPAGMTASAAAVIAGTMRMPVQLSHAIAQACGRRVRQMSASEMNASR